MSQSTLFKMKVALPSRDLANTANTSFGINHAAFKANAERHQPLRLGQGRF